MNPGAYSAFRTGITPEEMDVFNSAMGKLIGVNYEPIAVSTQVVEGMNYRFLCNASIAYPNAAAYTVLITIYRPLDGPAHIESIEKI